MYDFLLFLGAGLVLVGTSLALSNLRNVARRKRILATATSPISQAMGGPVEIEGNIVPSEKGLVEAPLSGRQAVWTRVTVEQYRSGSDGNPGGSSIVLSEVNSRPFFVDDNSGEVARIIFGRRQRCSRSAVDREFWPVPRPATGIRGVLEHARSQQQGLLRL